jgi:hypothetical protein
VMARSACPSCLWMTSSEIPSRDISTGVRVAELVWREPAPHSGQGGGVTQLRADACRCARPSPRRAAHDAEQSPDREVPPEIDPRLSCVHAQRSMPTSRRLSPLPWRTTSEPWSGCRSVSLSASASLIRRPARHNTTMIPRNRTPSGCRPRRASPRRSPRPPVGRAATAGPCSRGEPLMEG